MNWFALVVPSQRELAAVRELARIGCRAFAPTETVFVRQNANGQKVVRHRAIMSRYVFAADPNWYEVRQLQHNGRPIVTGVLSSNGSPYRLPNYEIMSLMHLAENGPPQSIPVSRRLSPGDVCVFADGSFQGMKVKVKADSGDGRMLCEFVGAAILGKQEIDLPVGLLKVAA